MRRRVSMQAEKGRGDTRGKRSSPVVGWIAVGLGVFLVMVGGMVLLWGLSYQATIGEPRDLEGDGPVGSPILVPFGFVCLALGALWLYHGIKGFRRDEQHQMKTCPSCGRKVEADLDFCYFCTYRFTESEEEGQGDAERGPPPREEARTSRASRDGPTAGQMERMRRREERRRAMERGDGPTVQRSTPLVPAGGPNKGQ